jgi:glutamine phosphoribosylpyrophosphate amidotransferase
LTILFWLSTCGGNGATAKKVCGILGLLLHSPTQDAAVEICEGLSLLQHRGQDACGIVTCGSKGRFYQCKANGMVRDVFDKKTVSKLIGSMGIGHGTSIFSKRPLSKNVAAKLIVSCIQFAILQLDHQHTQKLNPFT